MKRWDVQPSSITVLITELSPYHKPATVRALPVPEGDFCASLAKE